MNIFKYFKSVTTITANKALEMIKGKNPEEICLLDVRQPNEYQQGHIPGAVLIPIAQLPEGLGELDSKIPTITYCAFGSRSRVGTSILQDAGFKEAYNLKGGFKAWKGLSVEGPPETGMVSFAGTKTPEDILSIAWALEESSRRFFKTMAEISQEPEVKEIFNTLTEAEKNHQKNIINFYNKITGNVPDPVVPFYTQYLPKKEMEQLIEGQMNLEEVLTWARQHSLNQVLEYSISLGAKLYDLYFRLKKKSTEPEINRIYSMLAAEGKKNMEVFIDIVNHARV
jgi:sulfur-carrier protein adenylyltransferase/sulfurtransferase